MKSSIISAFLLIFCVKTLSVSAIVNGIDTPVGTEIRFHVHLHMQPPDGINKVGSGAYIGGVFVLTVAQNIWPYMESVSCGFANRNRDQLLWIPTVSSFIHPNYNVSNFIHNIAVLKLSASPILETNFVFPITMADSSVIQSEGTFGFIYGFGYTTNEGDFATILQQGQQFIQPEQSCASTQNFPHLIRQFNITFCARAGIIGQGIEGNNICNGDQGGAFVANGFLVGLSSYKWSENCFNGRPSVYVRVAGYRNWIKTITNF